MEEYVCLCIEDNDADFSLIELALQDAPFAVRMFRARDGEEAISFLNESGRQAGRYGATPRPDVILLDSWLPKQNGFEVLEYMRSRYALNPIPVIMLSSSRDPRDIKQALALGARQFITKTLGFDWFEQDLRNACFQYLGLPKPTPDAMMIPQASSASFAVR